MKPGLVIVGGGGHAKVVIDILEQSDEFEIAGFLSLEPQPEGLLGRPQLGDDDALDGILQSGIRSAFPALGDNRLRSACIASLERRGFEIANAVSVHAVVSRYAAVGRGVAIMAGAVVNAGARLGNGVIVNTKASVDHDCEIGNCVHIAPGVSLAGCVRIGAGTLLGVGSSVIPGVRIGEWSVVGAGSAVISDLPAGVLAAGVPAAVRRSLESDLRHV